MSGEEVRLPDRTIRDTRTRLQEIDNIVKTTTKEAIHYSEIARALNLRESRANKLLRLYAKLYGYPYRRGYLILKELKVFTAWEEVKPSHGDRESGEGEREVDPHGGVSRVG